ncbi:MAG: hypothetical protein B0D91_11100 [Oceanospirillales bacterium LUC14_002_19_P2]|nr:MAG: hypothetical protein B0D91_11100 [Oceanospirillales bacterium LUC14_002_19_P2]
MKLPGRKPEDDTHHGLLYWLSHHEFYFSVLQRISDWAHLSDEHHDQQTMLAEANAVITLRDAILSAQDQARLSVLDKDIHMLENAANIAILEELIKHRRDEIRHAAERR